MGRPSSVRLYVLLARKEPVAAVFRRGPSKQVLLLKWDLRKDTFESGQWLKGRVYERRCDLSPTGDRLVYFAATWKKPFSSWTAVSRPPYFTALALWPKGDGWGGGGLFEHEGLLALNHRPMEMDLADGFHLPRGFRLKPFGSHPGWGEDNPIWDARLRRDGWTLVSGGRVIKEDYRAPVWIQYDPPCVYDKPRPGASKRGLRLQMLIHGIKERDGSWYVVEHELVRPTSGERQALGRTDWADWDRNGDLLFASSGRLWRLPIAAGEPLPEPRSARELIDLREMRFEGRPAPAWATRWKG